jgi:tetratricopeptide (TPR) repeat protein
MNAKQFFTELKRRNVYKVAIAYAVVAWLLMQIATQVFPFLEIPNWAIRLVIMLIVIGFPIALVIAWAFELTPEGLKRTEDVDLSKSITRKTGRKLDFFVIAVLLLVISILLFQRLHRNVSPAVSSSLEKSIAVLPFDNLSRDPDNAYFSDGIQDEILTKLAGIGDLKDVFTVESEVAQEIADALRARLSPSQSNALATAPTRDTEAYDLFLKGEYEERQAESVQTAEPFDRAQTFYRQALVRDPNFALAYARLAYSELNRFWFVTLSSYLTSAELAEIKANIDRALAIAPASPDAHLALAVFHYWGHHDYDAGLKELDRVLELQPNSSLGYSYRAAIYRRRGEWQRALAEFDRAAQLDPRDPVYPFEIGGTYLALRRWNDAEHELTRALALDPHYGPAALFLARTYLNSTGDIRRARQILEGVQIESSVSDSSIAGRVGVKVYPDVLEKHFSDALKAWETAPTNTPEARLRQLEARVAIQVVAGQGAVAKSECEQLRGLLETRLAERPEDRDSLTALACAYVCLERNADAVRVARQAADLLPIEKDALVGPGFLAGLAEIEARTGHAKEAIKILRRLITTPAGVSVTRLKIDPVWDPIRNDPDFQKLISEPEPATVYK